MKGEHITELEDEKWLMKLAFLYDITVKLNDLNLSLQGKNKSLTDMVSVIKTFKETIKRYASQLRKHKLRNFKNMEEVCIHIPNRDFEDFAEHLDGLFEEFERRFADLIRLEEMLIFMIFPFNENVHIDGVSEKIGHLIDTTSVKVEEKIMKLKKKKDAIYFLNPEHLAIQIFGN
ncbi:general transcription factor II-I repeat domain-containing 2A-like protein [Trichonephila clavipes]|nr:general transcription factor II-I repeat domain-containing 2A-like protein [Trichonephila clavipes]